MKIIKRHYFKNRIWLYFEFIKYDNMNFYRFFSHESKYTWNFYSNHLFIPENELEREYQKILREQKLKNILYGN